MDKTWFNGGLSVRRQDITPYQNEQILHRLEIAEGKEFATIAVILEWRYAHVLGDNNFRDLNRLNGTLDGTAVPNHE